MRSSGDQSESVPEVDDELLAALRGAEAEQLDEESSPLDPQTAERTLLYLQIFSVDQPEQPLPAGVEVEISGEGLPEPRHLVTDLAGEVLIEDCGPGLYTVRLGERQARVHSLTDADLGSDATAYRVLI